MTKDLDGKFDQKSVRARGYENFSGSIYEDNTEAQHNFLLYYSGIIKQCGWRTMKAVNAYTIRINPVAAARDILLNTRLQAVSLDDSDTQHQEQDIERLFLYKKSDVEIYKNKLIQFSDNNEYSIKYLENDDDFADRLENDKLFDIGELMIPLEFDGNSRLNENRMIKIWTELYRHLSPK